MSHLHGPSGYTFFKDIPEGSPFFFLGSTVPHYKGRDDTHYLASGPEVLMSAGPDEAVVPIKIEFDGHRNPETIYFGHHPLPLTDVRPEIDEGVTARHEAYVARRLEAEGGGAKKQGGDQASTGSVSC